MVKYALAVDLGGTNLRVALGDDKGRIVVKLKEKTPHSGQGKDISAIILKMMRLIMETNRKIEGVGAAVVGPLDMQKKSIVNTPNLPFPLIPLSPLKQINKPVYVLNDASAAVLGEKYFGAGKKVDNLVYITISSGIGGGAIVDGHFLLGKDGNAVEPGHMVVDSTYNLDCNCKKGKGHWRSYAGGDCIGQFCRVWLKRKGIAKVDFELSAEGIFSAAEKGNAVAQSFVDEVGTISGRALNNVIVAYSPSLITLGGSIVFYHPQLFLRSIRGKIDTYLKLPEIKVSSLGDDIGLLGALAAVFHQHGIRI